MNDMRPLKLILRCYADKEGDQWQAFCLDLSLAAQASSFEEAKGKLERMILDYVHDALAGEDREYAADLLARRAPARYWLRYYFYMFLCRVGSIQRGVRRLFTESLPLTPDRHYNHA